MPNIDDLRSAIRDVPDFPKPGIVFKDITPVFSDAALLRHAAKLMAEGAGGLPVQKVAGIDARGFIFGVLVAQELGAGFIPVRKAGKLPWKTVSADYALEYGTATVEMHEDAVEPGERVLLVDDLLATGGTAAAAASLIQRVGGEVVGTSFFIELDFLAGREKLAGAGHVHSLIRFD